MFNSQGRLAQTSYVTCWSCTVNECIPDLPRLVLWCTCQQCKRVKGWSLALLQGKHCLPLEHTRRSVLFSQQTCPVFHIQTGQRLPRGDALLYSRGHSQSVSHKVKHKDGSVLDAHKQPHCLISESSFISISGVGAGPGLGWCWW